MGSSFFFFFWGGGGGLEDLASLGFLEGLGSSGLSSGASGVEVSRAVDGSLGCQRRLVSTYTYRVRVIIGF